MIRLINEAFILKASVTGMILSVQCTELQTAGTLGRECALSVSSFIRGYIDLL